MSAGDLGRGHTEGAGISFKGVCLIGVEGHERALLSKEMQWYLPLTNLILSKSDV